MKLYFCHKLFLVSTQRKCTDKQKNKEHVETYNF